MDNTTDVIDANGITIVSILKLYGCCMAVQELLSRCQRRLANGGTAQEIRAALTRCDVVEYTHGLVVRLHAVVGQELSHLDPDAAALAMEQATRLAAVALRLMAEAIGHFVDVPPEDMGIDGVQFESTQRLYSIWEKRRQHAVVAVEADFYDGLRRAALSALATAVRESWEGEEEEAAAPPAEKRRLDEEEEEEDEDVEEPSPQANKRRRVGGAAPKAAAVPQPKEGIRRPPNIPPPTQATEQTRIKVVNRTGAAAAPAAPAAAAPAAPAAVTQQPWDRALLRPDLEEEDREFLTSFKEFMRVCAESENMNAANADELLELYKAQIEERREAFRAGEDQVRFVRTTMNNIKNKLQRVQGLEAQLKQPELTKQQEKAIEQRRVEASKDLGKESKKLEGIDVDAEPRPLLGLANLDETRQLIAVLDKTLKLVEGISFMKGQVDAVNLTEEETNQLLEEKPGIEDVLAVQCLVMYSRVSQDGATDLFWKAKDTVSHGREDVDKNPGWPLWVDMGQVTHHRWE